MKAVALTFEALMALCVSCMFAVCKMHPFSAHSISTVHSRCSTHTVNSAAAAMLHCYLLCASWQLAFFFHC